MKRVAALYDIHGNLPALEAVLLEQVREIAVDRVVVGGDVVVGPMARETLQRLLAVPIPAQFIYGNAEIKRARHLPVCANSIDRRFNGLRNRLAITERYWRVGH